MALFYTKLQIIFSILLLFVITQTAAISQTISDSTMEFNTGYGIIKGTVVDDTTGQSVPLVNVIVNDTQFGAASDEKGEFLIKNLPAGIYDIEFSHVSYENDTVKQVKLLQGRIITINMRLKTKYLGLYDVIPGLDSLDSW